MIVWHYFEGSQVGGITVHEPGCPLVPTEGTREVLDGSPEENKASWLKFHRDEGTEVEDDDVKFCSCLTKKEDRLSTDEISEEIDEQQRACEERIANAPKTGPLPGFQLTGYLADRNADTLEDSGPIERWEWTPEKDACFAAVVYVDTRTGDRWTEVAAL